jgi:AcrR family transcriptional regulator
VTGRQRAPRKIPDLDQVLAVTIELLEKHGESGFRIEELQRRTGISKSSLYLRFGDRDGLLAAAFSKIFEEIVLESVAGMELVLRRANSSMELQLALRGATAFVASAKRHRQRVDRAAIFAGTRGRDAYRAALSAAQTQLTDRIEGMLLDAQNRGLVKLRHGARVISQMIQAVTLGRLVAEFDDKASDQLTDEWVTMVDDILAYILFDGLVHV